MADRGEVEGRERSPLPFLIYLTQVLYTMAACLSVTLHGAQVLQQACYVLCHPVSWLLALLCRARCADDSMNSRCLICPAGAQADGVKGDCQLAYTRHKDPNLLPCPASCASAHYVACCCTQMRHVGHEQQIRMFGAHTHPATQQTLQLGLGAVLPPFLLQPRQLSLHHSALPATDFTPVLLKHDPGSQTKPSPLCHFSLVAPLSVAGPLPLQAITMCVSLLHTVFDMLAFKNDIGFWKNNKSMEGLSARSVIINACCQLVILLYLIENDTSYVVLFSSFLGTVIEFWKVCGMCGCGCGYEFNVGVGASACNFVSSLVKCASPDCSSIMPLQVTS